MSNVPSDCPKCPGLIVQCTETRRSLFGGMERNVCGNISSVSCGKLYCPEGHWLLGGSCTFFGPECLHLKTTSVSATRFLRVL